MRYFRRHIRIAPSHNILKQTFAISQNKLSLHSFFENINLNDRYIEDMLTAKEIRNSFKNFFESKGHHIVPSAPMVIKDDPTLMFTNAGMNQFKDIIWATIRRNTKESPTLRNVCA